MLQLIIPCMGRRVVAAVGLLWLASSLVHGQTLQMQLPQAQGVIVGQSYTLPLTTNGGAQPYTWQLAGGELPPGCKLHARNGRITCVPTTAGDYHFTVAVTDSSIPQLRAQHDLTIHVIEGLTVSWQELPRVHGDAISGSVIISNQTSNDFDLTVVIVAVNEIGRSTALGYQHFILSANTTSPVIPFGSSPGNATYYVRADAEAHRPGYRRVYRASKQTPATLKVTQF